MKKNLLALIALAYLKNSEACLVQTDPNRIVLFVNANMSFLETQAAATAACKRGETFVKIPNTDDKLIQEIEVQEGKRAFLQLCKKNCKTQDEELKLVASKLSALKSKAPQIFKKDLDLKIAELSKANKAITTIIFSGHNGGGGLAGTAGRINKNDFFDSMNRHYKNKPSLKNELGAALLWGCYSATPEEVMAWKSSFPALKIIAGFNGIAPSKVKNESATIMKDIIAKQKQMIEQKTSADVLKLVKQIENLNLTHAGIYVNACSEQYYYSKDSSGVHFKTFEEMKKCDSPELQNKLLQYNEYFSGSKPIIEEDVRSIYEYARKYDHCFGSTHPLEGNHVALLMFFKEVKYNFGNVFAKLTVSADLELKALSKEITDLEKSFRFTRSYSGEEVKNFKLTLDSVSKTFFLPTSQNLNAKERKEILSNISVLEPLVKHSMVNKVQALKAKMKNLIHLQDRMQNYLYELRPACMDFLEWHYMDQSFLPQAKC
jgi:hypothetical protein